MLEELNVGVAQLAQALLQVLAEAAQGQLDDIDVAKQLLVQCVTESDQPGGRERSRVVTWAREGNLEGCLSSTTVPTSVPGNQNHCLCSMSRKRGIRGKCRSRCGTLSVLDQRASFPSLWPLPPNW